MELILDDPTMTASGFVTSNSDLPLDKPTEHIGSLGASLHKMHHCTAFSKISAQHLYERDS